LPIPKDFVTPTRISAKERAYTQIQRWIIEGTLHPGEKINDAELAEALGVSRTPVREALQLLEYQGLIEMRPGRDTRVTLVEKEQIFDIYPILASLHALAAERFLQVVQPHHIEELRRLNREFAEKIAENQLFEAMELDEEFHNVVVEGAQNPYLSSFSSTLQLHIKRFKYLFLKHAKGAMDASVAEHDAMIDALVKKDREALIHATKRNWLRTMEQLHHYLSHS
jgi:DNA-binding GntR family transcriptional regulator